MNDQNVLLIDGNSLMNRAYYAIRQPMMTGDGMYTQGIFAFLNMLNKLLQDYDPAYAAVAFDRKTPTFRHEAYREYKAGRKKMPPELAMQFPVLKEILEAMHIAVLEIDGYEADDILGTVSREAEEQGLHTFIITGDRDAFQLASDLTSVIYTKRGVSSFDRIDRDAIQEEYGFPADHFIDYKAMMGDSSDNIPGIPGVGDKTARRLTAQYGTLENLILSVDEMKAGKLKNNIEEFAAQAMIGKKLVTIFRQVPLDSGLEDYRRREPDYGKLAELYRKLEFRSFLKKLPQTGSDSGSREDLPAEPASGYELFRRVTEDTAVVTVQEDRDFAAMTEDLLARDLIWMCGFHDNGHTEAPLMDSICLGEQDTLYFIPWNEKSAEQLRPFFAEYQGRVAGHNLKPVYYALMRSGGAVCQGRPFLFNTAFDSAIAAYLLDPSAKSYDLSELMSLYFQEKFPTEKEILSDIQTIDLFGESEDRQAKYGKRILEACGRLLSVLTQELQQSDLLPVFETIELPLVEVLASLESSGMHAEEKVIRGIGDSLTGRIEELTAMIHAAAGEEFNINSPQQLGGILFEKLHLKNGKKLKTGYSTSAEVLEKIADQHVIVPMVLEYRMLKKLSGTYVDGMLPLIGSDGKIHAHFQQTVTTTGRLSCTEPNLQNIPVKTDLGRQFRGAFTSEGEERILVGADYSQVELRIMAHLSEDPAMIESFVQNQDIHTMTAARVFGVEAEEVTPAMRSRAKAVNFGIIYGISPYGLSRDLHIPVSEASDYLDAYFDVHPKVQAYMKECVTYCKEHGYVKTIFGRRRKIPEIHASAFNVRQMGERLAMNTPVQGSAADIMKIAMIQTYHALNTECPRARIVLQVHDELIIDAPVEEQNRVMELLGRCMSSAASLRVSLAADVNAGRSWLDLK